jgi:hypothetical protein
MSNTAQAESIIIASSKDCPSSTIFEIVKETEKAIQIKNCDINPKHAYPVWVPKSQIAVDTINVPKCGDMPAVTVKRNYFKASVFRMMDTPWKRVAIGFSCY